MPAFARKSFCKIGAFYPSSKDEQKFFQKRYPFFVPVDNDIKML
jgi:hypothetical protein